jgi:hypothetical protein
MDRDVKIIAVDPGEEHNGVAVFIDGACRFTASVRRDCLFNSLGAWAGLFCRALLVDARDGRDHRRAARALS